MHTTRSGLHTHNPASATRGRPIRWAHHYDRVVRLLSLGQDKALREKTVDLVQVKPGDRVLDVGCGTGDLTIAAKARAGSTGHVYGIDAAPEMIDVARAKAAQAGIDIDFRVNLIEALPFADQSFEVVLSSLMMHHLPDDLKRKGLAEIYRVLRSDGQLLVVDMKRPTTRPSRLSAAVLMHGKMETGAQDLPAMLSAVGFTHIEAGDAGFPMIGFVRGRASH